MIKLVEATDFDISHVAQNLHPSDLEEVKLLTGMEDPLEAIKWSCDHANKVFTVIPQWGKEEGSPCALFGCTEDTNTPDQQWGIPWMVSTRMNFTTSVDIINASKKVIKDWMGLFPTGLHNVVWSGNIRHIKWIKKQGFQVFTNRVAIVRKQPFFYFEMLPHNNPSIKPVT